MKRSIAFLLALMMAVTMIPASLLPVLAHGIGVGKNDIDNISIDNGAGTTIPVEIDVDGVNDDTAWAYEDWNSVNSTTGVWNVTTAKNSEFSYKYQLHTDYKYLYGIFVVDTNGIYTGELGDITVWIHDGTADVTTYTDKIILKQDGTFEVYNGEVLAADNGADSIDAMISAVGENLGVYTIEFRTLISNITDADVEMTSYVSVAVGDEKLYYPRFDVTDSSATEIDPATSWPGNAVEITQWDIAASHQAGDWGKQNADFSEVMPSEIHVDGELNEGIWDSFTDFYRVDEDVYEYRNDSDAESQDGYEFADLSVGYSDSMYYYDIEDGKVNIPRPNISGDLKINDPVYFTTDSNGTAIIDTAKTAKKDYRYDARYLDFGDSPLKFKYDIRSSSEYLYGAILANVDVENTDLHYHIKDYVQEVEAAGETVEDGYEMTVPIYFYVVFESSTTQAYTLQVKCSYTVQYSASLDTWRYVTDSSTSDCYLSGGIATSIPAATQKTYASARRLGRYLVSMEFRIPLADVGLLDDTTGNYYNSATGECDATSLSIKHTIAMANTYSMYHTYVVDVEETNQDVTKVINYYSYGYKDETTGNAIAYTADTEGAERDEDWNYRIYECSATVTDYEATFDAGLYAYHAWSLGGGTVASKPVEASQDSTVRSPSDININGYLENSYWANLNAADTKINSMGRAHTDTTQYNEAGEFIGKGEENAEDGIISTFYHELYADNEYIYGAAIMIDGDGSWEEKTADDNAYDTFRLWLNTGCLEWGESYNYYVNFYIDQTLNTSIGNIAVAEVFAKGDNYNPIATSTSANIANANLSDTTDAQLNGHGIEVEMRVVENYQLRDIAKTEDQGGPAAGYYPVDLTVLEFRIPLDVFELTGAVTSNGKGTLTAYAASLEYFDDDGSQGLCWPLQDNTHLRISGDTTINGNPIYDDRMYINPWNALGTASLSYGDKTASTVKIDGNPAEEIWNNDDERISVDSVTGTWDSFPMGEDIFDYAYKVYTGRNYVYGMAQINADAVDSETAFTLWVNADGSGSATHKFDFMIEDGTAVCYKTDISTGTKTTVSFTGNIVHKCSLTNCGISTGTNGGMGMNSHNGTTYLEFMLPMDEFETARDGYEYVVSVTHNGYTLFHPDNSNVVGNTETLWLTHYNYDKSVVGSASGTIVNSAIAAMQIQTDYRSRTYFAPTEYEGIYQLVKFYDSATTGVALSEEITEVYGEGGMPEGGFVYLVGSGNVANKLPFYGNIVTNNLNYNDIAMNKLKAAMNGNEGIYVRFTGVDLLENRINTLYDDQWNSDFNYFEYGYGTDATFTVVDVANYRTGEFPETAWDGVHAQVIPSKTRFYPETIDVNGAIDEHGWSDDRWVRVENKQNGNTNNSGYSNCETEFGYEYQMRMDDDYVYVAAVIDVTPESKVINGVTSVPAFRVWIQSQSAEYDGAVSFTHLFDVRSGETVLSVNTEIANAQLESYNNHYLPADGVDEVHIGADYAVYPTITEDENGYISSGYLTYSAGLRAAENVNGLYVPKGGLGGTVVNKKYGETSFYGETIIDAENLNTAEGEQEYEAEWFASIDVESYIYADGHAAYGESVDGRMVVEFKFALADIGCEDGDDFEYYVEARSEQPSESDSYCLYYPPLPNESCVFDGDYVRSYYFPYWVWGNTAIYVDAEAREAMKLRNPAEPVTSLGAQYIDAYTLDDESTTKALKFGLLYNQQYLDNAHNDGATYWDVKEIGLVLDISQYLTLNGNDVALYKETEYVTDVVSDSIENQAEGSCMADYESYVSYTVVVIPEGKEDADLTYRGYVEYYPSDDIYYDHPWLTGGTSEDGKDGWTYRETYYSDAITRNYSLVKLVADGGIADPVIPDPHDIVVPLTVTNVVNNLDAEQIGADGFTFVLSDSEGVVASEVSNANGIAGFGLTYSKADAGNTYTYTLALQDDGIEHLTYDTTVYTITVSVEHNTSTNRLVPTVTVNDATVTSAEATFTNIYDHTLNGTEVVYVPLDNRPVNLDRAEYLADASAIKLIMPDESLLSNTLSSTASECDQGNPEEILAWLKGQDADYYVLSVDMLFSGGLVGSRAPFFDTDDSIANLDAELGSYALSDLEQQVLDYIIELSKTKHVVLFDTVMRLASTANYAGWSNNMYNFLRNEYAFAERKQLSGTDLTIEAIVSGYKYDKDGNLLSTVYSGDSVDYASTVEEYLRARERKLVISDALYSAAAETAADLFIGVDDSIPDITVQTNEVNYIKNLISGTGSLLFAGADELGLMGLSEVVTTLHDEIDVKLTYFGDAKDLAADHYDYESLDNSVTSHIDAVGGNIITSGTADMEILVLTRADYDDTNLSNAFTDDQLTEHQANIAELIAKLKTNLSNNIPTCVIDGSGYPGYGYLADAILAAGNEGYGIANILGFSAWNTAGNAIGISLANAAARCSYISDYADYATDETHYGFLQSIAYSYIKDDVYKKNSGKCYASSSFFFNEADIWLDTINGSGILTAINNGVGTSKDVADVRVSNLHFPWNRSFEADFDVQIVAANSTTNLLTSLERSELTGTDNYDTFTAADWWWGTEYNLYSTDDLNNPPYASVYTGGAKLTDGNIVNYYGSRDEAKVNWYGMGYHPTDGETNANKDDSGVVNLPSIKFSTPQDVDQLKIHFLYLKDYSIYLPEKMKIVLRDANGNVIATVWDYDIRSAEGTAVAEGEAMWYNMTFDQIYEDVSIISIRPYTVDRSTDTMTLFGWTFMDEIEVYTSTALN